MASGHTPSIYPNQLQREESHSMLQKMETIIARQFKRFFRDIRHLVWPTYLLPRIKQC